MPWCIQDSQVSHELSCRLDHLIDLNSSVVLEQKINCFRRKLSTLHNTQQLIDKYGYWSRAVDFCGRTKADLVLKNDE